MGRRVFAGRPLAAALGTLVIVAGPSVSAQTPEQQAVLRQNCTGDYMRLCAQFDPGTPQVEQCFRARMKELSPACSAAISAYQKGGGKPRTR